MNKILIVKHGALGDVIRTSYFLEPFFNTYGKPDIYWFTSKSSFPLLRFHPYIFHLTYDARDFKEIHFDWIISLDDEREILEEIKNLEPNKFTGAFIENNQRKYTSDSALWFDMGLISKFGKKKADELKKENKKSHAEIFSEILGIKINKPSFFNSPVIESGIEKDSRFFTIGINSGAGGRWESKKLRKEETVKLVNSLLEREIQGKSAKILLLGGKDEQLRNMEIKQQSIDKGRVSIPDTSSSLLFFAAVVKSCDYIITSDSLALHLAVSQGIKNLSFYAPTSAAEIDTFATGVKVISTSSDYCNYASDCDNSSITALRILEKMKESNL